MRWQLLLHLHSTQGGFNGLTMHVRCSQCKTTFATGAASTTLQNAAHVCIASTLHTG